LSVLSADGCELYFASRRIGGTYHLFRTQVVNWRHRRELRDEHADACACARGRLGGLVELRVEIVQMARNIRARRET
jgi:hypothetical protein